MHTLTEPLPEALARVLTARGYQILTHVQRAVLSASARGADLLVSSPTGSGKTLAYGLALAEALLRHPPQGAGRPRGVVIAPTRELAAQVHVELAWLLSGTGIGVSLCTGGRDLGAEARELGAGAAVLVGSPGRLRHHGRRGTLDLAGVACVVLDEVDELLRLGFRGDVEALLAEMPRERRTLMFSATVTPEVERLSRRHQPGRVRVHNVEATQARAAAPLHAMIVARAGRVPAIVNLLRFHRPRAALVFCGRRDRTVTIAAQLRRRGVAAEPLSGALGQSERNAAVAGLRSGRVRVCVATDLAARGLDLPRLDLVVHADLPSDAAALVHRTGRTGRAGRPGRAVFLVAAAERSRLAGLMRRVGWRPTWVPVPNPPEIFARDLDTIVLDPAFRGEATDADRALAQALARTYSAERIAVACARLWRARLPVPGPVGPAVPVGSEIGAVRFEMELAQGVDRGMRHVLREIARRAAVPRTGIGRVRRFGRRVEFELPPDAGAGLAARIGAGAAPGIRILGME